MLLTFPKHTLIIKKYTLLKTNILHLNYIDPLRGSYLRSIVQATESRAKK